MLIRNTKRLYGRLTGVHNAAAVIRALAKAFRPKLRIPIRNVLERIGIRHHNAYVAALFHSFRFAYGCHVGHVIAVIWFRAKLIHICRTGKQLLYIYSAYCRRNKTHGAKLRKSSAHTVRHIECFQSVRLGYLYQVALYFIRCCNNMPAPLIAKPVLQYPRDIKKLGHGFARSARFCYNVEHSFFNVYNIQKRCHALRVNIILHIKLRPAAAFAAKLIVAQVAERLLHGYGAERAAAYAQHNERFVFVPHPFGDRLYARHHFRLVMRQFAPFHVRALCGHAFGCPFILCAVFFYIRHAQAMFAHKIGHHAVYVQPQLHAALPCFVLICFHAWSSSSF